MPVEMIRLRKFLALEASDRYLFVQAWFLLIGYGLALRWRSVRSVAGSLDRSDTPIATSPLTVQQRESAVTTAQLVARAASVTPWACRCLPQALATRHLLARRGISGQLFLGVRTGEGGGLAQGFGAHAWLVCGDVVVCGASGHEDYTVISAFTRGEQQVAPGCA